MTAPQVDYRAAVDKDRYRGANVAAFVEVLRKRLAYAFETRIAFSLDSWHGCFLLAAVRLLSLPLSGERVRARAYSRVTSKPITSKHILRRRAHVRAGRPKYGVPSCSSCSRSRPSR